MSAEPPAVSRICPAGASPAPARTGRQIQIPSRRWRARRQRNATASGTNSLARYGDVHTTRVNYRAGGQVDILRRLHAHDTGVYDHRSALRDCVGAEVQLATEIARGKLCPGGAGNPIERKISVENADL